MRTVLSRGGREVFFAAGQGVVEAHELRMARRQQAVYQNATENQQQPLGRVCGIGRVSIAWTI